jgi:hypothetical protein
MPNLERVDTFKAVLIRWRPSPSLGFLGRIISFPDSTGSSRSLVLSFSRSDHLILSFSRSDHLVLSFSRSDDLVLSFSRPDHLVLLILSLFGLARSSRPLVSLNPLALSSRSDHLVLSLDPLALWYPARSSCSIPSLSDLSLYPLGPLALSLSVVSPRSPFSRLYYFISGIQ